MNANRPPRLTLLALVCSLTLPAAYAQTAAPEKKDGAPGADPAAAASPDQVIVTANRRQQLQQKVSGVVQSLDGDQLRRDGITELRQVQAAVPGLNIANQEGNVEIYIRGVGSANNTELGDPGAAPHINGIYIPRPRGLGMMFYDLDRVEINKGPQGTLYGRNALAGTINLITAQPRLGQFGGYAQLEVSNRGGRAGEAALNIPLGDTAAVRVAATGSKRDFGFSNHTAAVLASGAVNPAPPQMVAAAGYAPAGLEENHGGRASLVWEPTERLRVRAMVDGGKESGTGYPGANIFEATTNSGLRPEELDLRKVVYRGTQGEMRNDLWGAQLKVDYALSDSLVMEWSSSRRSVDFYQRNASSTSIDYPRRNYAAINWDDFSSQYWVTKSKSSIHEFRLTSSNPKSALQWSAGAFSFREDQQVGYLSLADAGYCCYSGTEFTMPDVKAKSTALFADGTLAVSDRLRALGGLRYTNEEKYRYGIGGNVALTLGAENWDCCFQTRFGTEGFAPALLNRPNFDVSGITTAQQRAQFLIQTTLVPGARDTMIRQIGAIANGSNPAGECFTRPDIDNGRNRGGNPVTCPTTNPSNTNGGFSYANLTIPGQQVGSSEAKYGDARLGFEYDLSKDRMVYGKVSTGHKSGGFNDSFQGAGLPEIYEPEKLTVLELGLRSAGNLLGRRAVFNVTGFHYQYKNQVFQDLTCIAFDAAANPPCTGYSLVNRNVGASRLTGLELEARMALAANVKLDLSAVLLDTEITRGQVADVRGQDFGQGGITPIISLVGNQLPLASKISLAARLQHVIPLGSGRLDWQALLSYRSAYHLTQFNETDVVFVDGTRRSALEAGFPDRQKGFATVNLGLGYQLGATRFEVFANNVTNEQVSNKSLVGSGLDIRFLNDARSYGMRMRVDF